MAYRIEIDGKASIDLQNARLAQYEALADTHYKNAMRSVLKPVLDGVKRDVPVFSGGMREAMTSRVSGEGSNITGIVRPRDAYVKVTNIVEYGRHKTNKYPPIAVIMEKFGVPENEAFLIARAIAAPGSKARQPAGFMAKGQKLAEELAVKAIEAANERIVNDLVVK